MTSQGIKTSEFWLTLVTLLICGFLIYTGKMNIQEAIAFAGIAASYNLSRGFAKKDSLERSRTR